MTRLPAWSEAFASARPDFVLVSAGFATPPIRNELLEQSRAKLKGSRDGQSLALQAYTEGSARIAGLGTPLRTAPWTLPASRSHVTRAAPSNADVPRTVRECTLSPLKRAVNRSVAPVAPGGAMLASNRSAEPSARSSSGSMGRWGTSCSRSGCIIFSAGAACCMT